MPKRAHVTRREETVLQVISCMTRPVVNPKPLNRPRKSGELPLAGFAWGGVSNSEAGAADTGGKIPKVYLRSRR
jgi:hypothetical protein